MSDDLNWALAQIAWPEYPEPHTPHGEYRDCTQATDLTLIRAAGLAVDLFVAGVNTAAERERFEDAEGLPESQQEQGLVGYGLCDVASLALYGVATHDATEGQLPGLLAEVGLVVGLPGQGAGLPSGITVRHSVAFVPIGGGQVRVLDPARNWIGTMTVDAVIAWHNRLPTDIRYVRRDEFAPAPYEARIAMQKVSIKPVRIVDSRTGLGTTGGYLRPRVARKIQVAGVLGIPAEAVSVVGNLTMVSPDAPGFAVIQPVAGVLKTSTVNFPMHDTRANAFDIGLAPDGSLVVYATAPAHFLIDITGYFLP
jgi:hypothetical protein